MKRVMIVDAYNQFIRSFIKDPSTSYNGQPIGGSKGFLKIMNKLCRQTKPDAVVVVWDGQGGSKRRRSMNKNYKSGRKPARLNRVNSVLTEQQENESRVEQQIRLMEYLNNTPVIQFIEPNIEADDVIAFLSRFTKFRDWQKVIVSSDKDFIQVLDDKTVLLRPIQNEVLNTNKVLDSYGIHPNNFALARAISGDNSDNLKGVPGVGLETLRKRFPVLANERGCDFQTIFEHCEKMLEESKLKVYTNILSNRDVVMSNYRIMQLALPSISALTKRNINEVVDNHQPEFNKTKFKGMMFKDGFGEISLSDFFQTLNRIVASK
tara:strand:+ start:1416 stop:2378 length:963 start_codon:yes stop_codon:yes gene_type:complete